MKKLNYRSNVSGEGLVIVIILIVLIGGGLWWLVSHKQDVDKEARSFGREMIKRVTVDHDQAFFTSHLSPQARLDIPPFQQQETMKQFQELGVPAQPIQIDENITWEGPWQFKFFEPRGFFTAHLNYPAGPATLEIAIDHPASRWQLINFTFTPPRAR
jgi:hypothetical protein